MTQMAIISLVQSSLWVFLKISIPILASAVLVGLIISILQAATSIQEQTLTFVPKIIAMVGILFILGTWMLNTLKDFTIRLFSALVGLAG